MAEPTRPYTVTKPPPANARTEGRAAGRQPRRPDKPTGQRLRQPLPKGNGTQRAPERQEGQREDNHEDQTSQHGSVYTNPLLTVRRHPALGPKQPKTELEQQEDSHAVTRTQPLVPKITTRQCRPTTSCRKGGRTPTTPRGGSTSDRCARTSFTAITASIVT